MSNVELQSALSSISSSSTETISLKLYEKITTELRCPGCSVPMRSPILLCSNGHSNCENCIKMLNSCPLCEAEFTLNRNLTLEAICSKAEFLCENSINGCRVRCTTSLLDWHENKCSYRIVKCFIGKVWGKCEWKGCEKDWLQHINKIHLDKVFTMNPTELKFHIKSDLKPLNAYYIFQMYNQVFSFYQIYDKINRKILWTMSFEPKDKVNNLKMIKYVFEIEMYDVRDSCKTVSQKYECHYNGDKDILRDGACATMSIEDISRFVDETKVLHYRVRIHKIVGNNKREKNQMIKDDKQFPINYQQISIEGVNHKQIPANKIITRQQTENSLSLMPSSDSKSIVNFTSSESIARLSTSDSDSESDPELQEFVNKLFKRQLRSNSKSNNSHSSSSLKSTAKRTFDTINLIDNHRKQIIFKNFSKSYKNMKANFTGLSILHRKRSIQNTDAQENL